MTIGVTDFHNHLIPGVDDGSQLPAESAASLIRFRAEGVTQIITTPHFQGSLTHVAALVEARLSELDQGWEVLKGIVSADAESAGSPLRVERGAEVALDVPDPELSDARLRLAGGPFVLVEYPGLRLPPVNAEMALVAVRRQGWIPVLAHPERYRNLDPSLAELARFREAGAFLQVNAGSLFGDYGKTAAALARSIFELGWADYVSSDFHAIGSPGVARFAQAMVEAELAEQLKLLTVINPGRILTGEPPLPVPPMKPPKEGKSLVQRLFG